MLGVMVNQDSLIERLRQIFVTIDSFELHLTNVAQRITPLERIVYGASAAIGLAVVGAIISGIIRK